MSKRRLLFGELLLNLAIFALLYGLAAIPCYAVLQSVESVVLLLTLAVPYFLLVLIRMRVNNLFLFLSLYALIFGVVAFGPGRWLAPPQGVFLMNLILAIYMVICCILSLVRRLKGKLLDKASFEVSFVVACVVTFAILTLLAGYLGYEGLIFLFPLLSVVIMLCYLLHTHIANIDYALELITETTSQPVDSILSFNNKMIACFLFLVIIMAAASRYFMIDRAIALMGSLLLGLVRFLFGRSQPREEIPAETAAASDMGGENGLMQLMDEVKEPSMILIILEKIITYLVFIAVILAVAAGVAYACYRLYKRFYNSPAGALDEKTFIFPDIATENVGSFIGMMRNILPAMGNAPDAKVRRLFYKKIRRLISKGALVKAVDTPREIARTAREFEDIEALVATYEKARYGGAD